MVIPKTNRGKVATGVKPSFREALGRTELKIRNGLKAAPPTSTRLQLTDSPSPNLSPKGRGVDVSVGKTWGTDLVATALRDAKFVPFRLLTGNSNPSAPMFAMVDASPQRADERGKTKDAPESGLVLAAGKGGKIKPGDPGSKEPDQTILRTEVVQIILKTPTRNYTRGSFESGIYQLSKIEPTDAEIDFLREHHPLLDKHVAYLATRINMRKDRLLSQIENAKNPKTAQTAHQEYMKASRRDEALLRLVERIVTDEDARGTITANLRVTMIQARQRADLFLAESRTRLHHIITRLRMTTDQVFDVLEPVAELILAQDEVSAIRASRPELEKEFMEIIKETIPALEAISTGQLRRDEFSAIAYKLQKLARIADQLEFNDLWFTIQTAVAKCVRQYQGEE